MNLKMISLDKIKPNPLQPREHFDREKLKELAKSVKEVGLIQPISVRPTNNGMYEIIAGERRWKALQIVGVKKIPAIVKSLKNGKLMIESLIENLHREDLSDVEKSKALRIIKEREGVKSVRDLATLVGLSKTTIDDILDSAGMRKELEGPSKKISQSVISETKGLGKKERIQVIKRAAKDDIGGRKVREMVSTAKKSPEPIRKALIGGKIETETAKKLSEIKDTNLQEKALNEIKRTGVIPDVDKIVRKERAKDLMQKLIKLRDGEKKTPEDYVSELSEKLTEVMWWIGKPQVVNFLSTNQRKKLLNRIRDLKSYLEEFETKLEEAMEN